MNSPSSTHPAPIRAIAGTSSPRRNPNCRPRRVNCFDAISLKKRSTFGSITAAAHFAKCSHSWMGTAIKTGYIAGGYRWAFTTARKPLVRTQREAPTRLLSADGNRTLMEWPSIKAALSWSGLTRSQLQYAAMKKTARKDGARWCVAGMRKAA